MAATLPSVLHIGHRRVKIGLNPRAVTISLRGSGPLATVQMVLVAGSKRTPYTISVKRDDAGAQKK